MQHRPFRFHDPAPALRRDRKEHATDAPPPGELQQHTARRIEPPPAHDGHAPEARLEGGGRDVMGVKQAVEHG